MQQSKPYSGAENLEVMREAKKYNRYLLDSVRKHAPNGGRILDFGAGNGQFAIPLFELGFNVTAVEPDDSLRQNLADEGIRASARIEDLPDQSFEYIYTLNVLEHIEDDINAIRQLHSKLAPNGTLLIYVPAFPVLFTSMDTKVGHFRRYTRTMLTTNVIASGFSVCEVGYVDSIGFFATLLFKLAGRSDGTVSRTSLRIYDGFVFPLSRVVDVITHRWFGKNLLLSARKPHA